MTSIRVTVAGFASRGENTRGVRKERGKTRSQKMTESTRGGSKVIRSGDGKSRTSWTSEGLARPGGLHSTSFCGESQ